MDNIVIRDPALTGDTGDMEIFTVNKFLWMNLPSKLLRYICKYLKPSDLQQLCLLCKHWHDSTHFTLTQKSKLFIRFNNVAKLRDILQNDDEHRLRLTYDSVAICDIQIIESLQPILKSYGSKIRTLSLYRSPVFDILNDCLPNLKELRVRYISTVQRDNLVSLNLGKFKNLRALDINCQSVSTDIVKDFMWKLTQTDTVKIEKLCVNIDFQDQDTLLNVLRFHSESLKQLEINFRGHGESILQWNETFTMLNHLEVVKFFGNISKEWLKGIINSLPANTPLRYFCLNNVVELNLITLVNNKWPRLLENLEFINCFDITNNHIKNLSTLHHSLRKLVIKNPHFITVHGLLQGIAAETNNVLKTLVFDNPRYCGNQILNMQLLIQRLPNLTNLSLKINADGVDDTVLSCIFRHLLHLQHLSLDSCRKITDNGLLGFGTNPAPISNLKDLQSLSLCHCVKITDKSLIECLKFTGLRKLTFGHSFDISSEGIKELVKNCPALEELTLSGCILINDDSILAIAKGLPRLRKLNADFCQRITSKCIDYILEFSRSLRNLSMQFTNLSNVDKEKNFEKLTLYGICQIQNMEQCLFCPCDRTRNILATSSH